MKLKMFSGSINKLSIIYIFILLQSCNTATVEQNKPSSDSTNQKLISVNKYMLKSDDELIKNYIHRHEFKMKQTESGLYYQVLKSKNGSEIKPGNSVTLKYKVELLDGTLCYSSDSLGNKKIDLGTDKIEAGLDEGLRLLKNGDVACFILLPHLAFGLSGDNNRIPPRSTIVYSIDIIQVK